MSRAAPSATTPRAPPTTTTPRGDSTIASAGSNFYGKTAPFGTSVQRFSPSATFAHHSVKQKPQFSSAANRKWMPRALAEQSAAALSELKGTPVSDRLAGAADDRSGAGDGASEHSAAVSSASAFSSSSTQQRQRQQRPLSARSARDEQRLSRQLRAEITQLREEKLAAARAGCAGGANAAASRCGPTAVVALDRLDGARLPGDEPLARLARANSSRGDENAPPSQTGVRIAGRSGGGESDQSISPEYASLLSFVAGEARRR